MRGGVTMARYYVDGSKDKIVRTDLYLVQLENIIISYKKILIEFN